MKTLFAAPRQSADICIFSVRFAAAFLLRVMLFCAALCAYFSDGSMLVMGHWSGTVDFSPDPSHTATAQSSTSDVYLLRYRPSGSVDWLLTIGSSKGTLHALLRADVYPACKWL